MNLTQWLNLIVAVALLFQPLVTSGPVEHSRSIEADFNPPFIQADSSILTASARNDQPYLPVLYRTAERTAVAARGMSTTAQSAVAASQTITNAEDIVYLVNSRQVGRTRNFSLSSPNWSSITGTMNTTILDFILDPNDPYHTAWAVGSDGVWRTTNLNAEQPTWSQILTIDQITANTEGYRPQHGVARIAADASRPGYFLLVPGYETADAPGYQDPWVGWTTDNGNSWSWSGCLLTRFGTVVDIPMAFCRVILPLQA